MNEKQKLYDEMCRVLTEWETQEATDDDLYCMLVKIQNNWETVITANTEDSSMSRIDNIANFAQRRDDEIAAKKKAAEDKEEFLKQTILGWSDQIQQLIDTANACVKHGIKFYHYDASGRNYDHNYFITDGCSHILGFEFNRCHPSTITRIGKEGGGCCDFDVYTDGQTITATGNSRLWALEEFVKSFDEFETKFYAYVDKVCQSK